MALRAGVLHLQRAGGPVLEMVPTGVDTFKLAAVPEAQIQFIRGPDGLVVEMRVLNREGKWESSKRRSP